MYIDNYLPPGRETKVYDVVNAIKCLEEHRRNATGDRKSTDFQLAACRHLLTDPELPEHFFSRVRIE